MHATEVVSSIKFTEILGVCISEIYYFQHDPSVSVLLINEHYATVH